jgi:pimeloyl-ACP methyl ester carboxylesterase
MQAVQKEEEEMISTQVIDSTSIAYWTNDGGPVDGKVNLIFIHGSGADHTVWEEQYSTLGEQANIFALDLPGHGLSGGNGEQQIGAYVEWIRKFIQALNLNKSVLVGHSLGAAICLSFAIHYGDMLSGIISLSGGVKMPVNPLILEGYRKDPVATVNMTWKFAIAKQNREKLAYRLEKNLANLKPDISCGDFLACDGLDIAEEISKIKIPTLLMCGTEDKMTPASNCQFMKDRIAGAQVALIENAGHLGMLENAEAFNEALRRFLSELDR